MTAIENGKLMDNDEALLLTRCGLVMREEEMEMKEKRRSKAAGIAL